MYKKYLCFRTQESAVLVYCTKEETDRAFLRLQNLSIDKKYKAKEAHYGCSNKGVRMALAQTEEGGELPALQAFRNMYCRKCSAGELHTK